MHHGDNKRVRPSPDGRGAHQLVQSTGPWPFITRRVYQAADGSEHVWQSRYHRKRLARAEALQVLHGSAFLFCCLWNPRQLNWWIGVVFALGASLFILGSLLVLVPSLSVQLSWTGSAINAVFFAGSIPFTTAAYLQLFQAANAGDDAPGAGADHGQLNLLGWQPHQIGWLSCALQFTGTILFNFNTFDAMLPDLTWLEQDIIIWGPNVAGSILFLASGHLAYAEVGHSFVSWRTAELSWWITFANLLGCIAFMISAVFAFIPPVPFDFDAGSISVLFTLLGATGFLVGSLLMLPEAAASD